MSEVSNPEEGVTPHTIKESMKRSGYTAVASSLALVGLKQKQMIEYYEEEDFNGNRYTACRVSPIGLEWMLQNQDRFRMRRGNEEPESASRPITDEDIPF